MENEVVSEYDMYAYARNDPMNARDPSGCFANPMGPSPSTFNGGGGAGRDCPHATYDSFQDCVDYYKHTYGLSGAADHCEDVCFGTVEGGSYPEPDDGIGGVSVYIDEDAYKECMMEEIIGLTEAMAICIISAVSVPLIVAAASAIGVAIPTPVTTAVGGAAAIGASFTMVYILSICTAMSFSERVRNAANALKCGAESLRWG